MLEQLQRLAYLVTIVYLLALAATAYVGVHFIQKYW